LRPKRKSHNRKAHSAAPKESEAQSIAETKDLIALIQRGNDAQEEQRRRDAAGAAQAEIERNRARGLAEHRDRDELRAILAKDRSRAPGQFEEGVTFGYEMGRDAIGEAGKAYLGGKVGGALFELVGPAVFKAAAPIMAAIIDRGGLPLELGTGEYTVYFEYGNVDVRYIGITNNYFRRAWEHLKNVKNVREIQPMMTGLTLDEARGVEQLLIEEYGRMNYALDPGSLTNKIGSISKLKLTTYKRLTNLGRQALRKVHWPGF
jgi:hypothetical protein